MTYSINKVFSVDSALNCTKLLQLKFHALKVKRCEPNLISMFLKLSLYIKTLHQAV